MQCEKATDLLREQIALDKPEVMSKREILTLRDISPEEFARYQETLPRVLRSQIGRAHV